MSSIRTFVDVTAVLALPKLVAAADPLSEEGLARARAVIPVVQGMRWTTNLQLARFSAGDRHAVLVDYAYLIAGHRFASRAVLDVVRAVRQEDVQHLS
jgi:hypothetical protein